MSCEERDLTFDQNNAFIAFRDPSGFDVRKINEAYR